MSYGDGGRSPDDDGIDAPGLRALVRVLVSSNRFRLLVCAPDSLTYENTALDSIFSSFETAFLFLGFSLAMFLFYSGVPLLLKTSGSTVLSLSLLTSNMWVALIQIFVYHEKVDWMYFVAFIAVALGLIAFSWGDEMNPPYNEVASTDEEVALGHSDNIGILDKDGSIISFQGVCIHNFQDSREQCVEMV